MSGLCRGCGGDQQPGLLGPAGAVCAARCCCPGTKREALNTRFAACLELPGKLDSVNRAAGLLICSRTAAQGKLLHSSVCC